MKNKTVRRLFAIAVAVMSILSMPGISSVGAADATVTEEVIGQAENMLRLIKQEIKKLSIESVIYG